MEKRALEVELVSAKDLKQVNYFTKMDVYAVVSILGDSCYNGNQETKTKLVRHGDTNPTFNFRMRFTIYDYLPQHKNLSLEVKLVSDRTLGRKTIGSVTAPIKELFDCADNKNMMTSTTYQVRRPSGRPQGELSFSYRFVEVAVPVLETVNKDVLVTAYPVGYPQQPSGSAYPPTQSGYSRSYGQPPQRRRVKHVQPKPAKTKSSSSGLDAGLVGGIIGGMILGDVLSSAGCGGGGGFSIF